MENTLLQLPLCAALWLAVTKLSDPAQCPAQLPAGGKHRSKPAASFSAWEALTMTQHENLLSHDTGGVWKCFEGDPCKALVSQLSCCSRCWGGC